MNNDALINWERVRLVCGILLPALKQRSLPYDEAVLPQQQIPFGIRENPLLHARFLFYACHYMRGTIRSSHAIKLLLELWAENPNYFDPIWVSKNLPRRQLKKVLKKLVLYKADEISLYWRQNSLRLVRHWNGDPRLIFEGITDHNEVYRRVTNKQWSGTKPKDLKSREWGFLGFQKKMASMLAYFLLEAQLIPTLTMSPPVDFHALRVMLGTGMIRVLPNKTVRYKQLMPVGMEILEYCCEFFSVSMVDVANALWLLSGNLCRYSPGNTSIKTRGKETRFSEAAHVDWLNATQLDAYYASCGVCPVEAFCNWNVRSGLYYDRGSFQLTERLKPS